jgi:hypothetical protein
MRIIRKCLNWPIYGHRWILLLLLYIFLFFYFFFLYKICLFRQKTEIYELSHGYQCFIIVYIYNGILKLFVFASVCLVWVALLECKLIKEVNKIYTCKLYCWWLALMKSLIRDGQNNNISPLSSTTEPRKVHDICR